MSEFFGSAWWLLVTLGVLVTFHEFGHFWVARRFGVKVLRFSIGFGKPIWSRIGRDGVEYAIGAIPLGGYVKFLDAREADRPELIEGMPGEYNAASPWKRIGIALAGPAFNIVFTIVAFWAMFVIGRPDCRTGGRRAARSGRRGRACTKAIASPAVNGEATDSWSAVLLAVGEATVLHRDASLSVTDAQGHASQHTLEAVVAAERIGQQRKDVRRDRPRAAVRSSRMSARSSPGIAGRTRRSSRSDDRIVQINDTPTKSAEDVVKAVAADAEKNPTMNLIGAARRLQRVPLVTVTAEKKTDGEKSTLDASASDSSRRRPRWNATASCARCPPPSQKCGRRRAARSRCWPAWSPVRRRRRICPA